MFFGSDYGSAGLSPPKRGPTRSLAKKPSSIWFLCGGPVFGKFTEIEYDEYVVDSNKEALAALATQPDVSTKKASHLLVRDLHALSRLKHNTVNYKNLWIR